jgi:hypothetical protein
VSGSATDSGSFYKDNYGRLRHIPARRHSMRLKISPEEIREEHPELESYSDLEKSDDIGFRDEVEMVRGIIKDKAPGVSVSAHMTRGKEQGVVEVAPAHRSADAIDEYPELHEQPRVYTDDEIRELGALGIQPSSPEATVRIEPGQFGYYLTNWLGLEVTPEEKQMLLESKNATGTEMEVTFDQDTGFTHTMHYVQDQGDSSDMSDTSEAMP